MSKKIKILHCITSLTPDGAQQMLYKVLSQMDHDKFSSIVINLSKEGILSSEIRKLGIEVIDLGMNKSKFSLSGFISMIRVIKQFQPDVLQGWMYHPNFILFLARFFIFKKLPLVFNIRKSLYKISDESLLTQIIILIGGIFSRFVQKVIYCNGIAVTQHQNIGYSKGNALVIHNGFDIERYQPMPEHYLKLREMLKISPQAKIVGIVARFDPQKDYPNFLNAAKNILETNSDVHFVLVGRHVDQNNIELNTLLKELKLDRNIHLLGERKDIPELMNGFDVYCLSSYSEGFPNSLGEAMSCGIPCVSTNTGAAADIVKDLGILVPIRNSKELANGMQKLLNLSEQERKNLKQACSNYIRETFSIQKIASQYYDLYSGLN